jgi:23S rRNA (cytidine2498-2'-O)-methyltransferase
VAVGRPTPERAILTAAPESEGPALADLRRATPFPSPERLAPGLFLLALPETFAQFSQRLRQTPPLFIRHIQPVQSEVPLTGEPQDLDRLATAALDLAPRLQADRTYSVQTRLLATSGSVPPSPEDQEPKTQHPTPNTQHPTPLSRFEINERLAAALTGSTGAVLDVRRPEQVVSVLATPSVAYLGISLAEENLSSWAGGAIRFAREPDQVSRSEFKLLESLEVFHLALPEAGRALDLGASPGGWTRVLRRAGLAVTAVDPGELDSRLREDAGIHHIRSLAQEYRCREDEYAVIVNDMRMDARDSSRLMLDFAPCLAPGGLAVLTLKLPERAPDAVAHQAIGLLLRRFDLLGARQLYHNRSEITVALSRRARPNGARVHS